MLEGAEEEGDCGSGDVEDEEGSAKSVAGCDGRNGSQAQDVAVGDHGVEEAGDAGDGEDEAAVERRRRGALFNPPAIGRAMKPFEWRRSDAVRQLPRQPRSSIAE